MAVVLYLASGDQRRLDQADAARLDDPFFIVTRRHPDIGHVETVLTLLAKDVVAAEVLHNGARIDFVPGHGSPAKSSQES